MDSSEREDAPQPSQCEYMGDATASKPSGIAPVLVLVVIIGVPVALCLWTAKRNPEKGIAGWLLLPAIGLVLNPILTLAAVAQYKQIPPETYEKFSTAIDIAIAKNAILLCLGIYLAILFFKKSSKAPKTYIIFLIANAAMAI